MATQTSNYSLTKAAYGERADIATYNTNMDYIDVIMADNRRIGIPMYDPTSQTPCNKGAIRGHEDSQRRIKCYECQEDNVTGPWDSTKWEQKSLGQIIEEVRENAGTDVEANPSGTATDTLEKLRVDNTIYAIPEDMVSKEAEGNPIEITDGASAPLVKCETAITGSQDLHGYDKPWVGGAGKNKLPNALLNDQSSITFEDVVMTVEGNGFHFQGTATNNGGRLNLTTKHITLPAGTYVFSYSRNIIDAFVESGNNIIASLSNPVFTLEESTEVYVGFNVVSERIYNETSLVQIESGSTPTTFAPYSNICPITAYDEGEIEVHGKNLVKQVVKGYIKVATNEIKIDNDAETVLIKVEQGEVYTFSAGVTTNRNIIGYVGVDELVDSTPVTNIKTLSSYTWRAEWSGWTVWYINASASADVEATAQVEKGGMATPYEAPNFTTHTTTYLTSIYRGSEDVVNGEVTTQKIKWTRNSSTMNNSEDYPGWNDSGIADIIGHGLNERITAIMSVGSIYGVNTAGSADKLFLPTDIYGLSQTEWIALAVDIDIVIELPTPTTSSVTPTNLPIKSLRGYNHIESSTGEMEVEYITSKYQPLVNLMKNMVVANPSEDATATLEKLKVNDTVYSLPSGGGGGGESVRASNTITVSGGVS